MSCVLWLSVEDNHSNFLGVRISLILLQFDFRAFRSIACNGELSCFGIDRGRIIWQGL